RRRRDPRPRPLRQRRVRVDRVAELVVRPVSEEVGGERGADEADERDQDDDDAAADRELVATEADPHALPVATRADRSLDAELTVRLRRDGRRKPCAGRNELWAFGGRHGSGAYRAGRPVTPSDFPLREKLALHRRLRIEGVAQSVAEQVERQGGEQDGD